MLRDCLCSVKVIFKRKQFSLAIIFILLLFQIKSSEGLTISKDGTFHRLKIHKVTEEFAGKYKFEADGRKTEAEIAVEGKNISIAIAIFLLTRSASFIKQSV